jgi:hypothetical protein
MRPFAIGLTAALAVAILIPAAVISAPKEEKGKPAAIDAKARETGMKEAAPAVIQASGARCTVTDARFIGNDKKAGAKYYEVACNEGMGFAVIAKKDVAPQVYTCLESSQPAADGKPRRPGLHPAGQRQSGPASRRTSRRPASTAISKTPAPSAPAPRTPTSKSPVRAARATSSRPSAPMNVDQRSPGQQLPAV